jgi:hypothetical protein
MKKEDFVKKTKDKYTIRDYGALLFLLGVFIVMAVSLVVAFIINILLGTAIIGIFLILIGVVLVV